MIYDILWILIFPGILYSIYCIIKNYKNLIFLGTEIKKDTKITFIIATKYCPKLVQDTIDSINISCKNTKYFNYIIYVVTDTLTKISDANIIVVPEKYTCDSKYKARSLNYSLQFLPNSDKEWIYHLDEDSKITEQTINALHHYINNNGKPIANGLSVCISTNNIFTFYAEAQRMWTYFLLKQSLKTVPMWMCGSNMLIRSDIEQTVMWNFRSSFIEDTTFAYLAKNKFGNIFGWHGALTIEYPAKNINQLLKQRKRWAYGGIKHIFETNQILSLNMYCIFSWIIGFFLLLLSIIVYNIYIPKILLLIVIIICLLRIEFGLYLIFKYNNNSLDKLDKYTYYIGLIFLSPLIELLCSFPAILAIINPPKGFDITKKI